MSSHGRGRGLRRNLEGTDSRPGPGVKTRASEQDSPIPDTFTLPDLIDLIDKVDIEKAEDKKTEAVWRITKCIKHLCSSEETLRSVVQELHRKSLESEDFGRKAARAFGNVSQLEVAGVKLRDVVLRNIQTDFKRKEDILAQDERRFLNSVSLLCEVFEQMRLADGTVINVLAVPILEYCDLLLTSRSEEAIGLLGRQLQVIGEEVQRSKPEKFTDFLLRVRELLVEGELSRLSRYVLLHLLECHLLRWPSLLPEKTGEWYSSSLGDRVLLRKPGLAPPSSRSNGHSKVKEEGLTAEDELVLQRVLGGGGGGGSGSGSGGPVSPQYQYNTPPPMLPGQYRPRGGRGAKVDINGVERLAVDMINMGLPPQVSPTARDRGRGGWHAMPPNVPPLSQPGPGPRIPTAIVPPGVPPHTRPQWRDNQRPSPSGPTGPPGSGGWNTMPQQHQHRQEGGAWHEEGGVRQDGGRHDGSGRLDGGRPGGSGRIMPGIGGGSDSHWAPKSGSGSWSSGGERGGGGGGGGGGFDIGTWENPGGARQEGAESSAWSRNDGMGSSSEGSGQGSKWSTNDCNDDTGFGTWENPHSKHSSKPARSEEGRGWSGDSWSQDSKSDWANLSAGSEPSPGSAWKKEPSVVGNWADDIQSPREQEENPLDVSLKDARRNLSNW